ncbi:MULTISPECIES: amidohydrolase family protein [Parafrankia]|uniref:Amidohydrolase n=1 Tax=Parafrankia soli TaxID=2599596 RepID=A0A1S1PJ51_9ACTN|nr:MULTISPECIES: amidohydrolase family protein [Parafrankia]OHV20945.1 amidohydrolase [Parafrankia soli]TCJ31965.1 amidohydrolase [Parafrankia sp. BMG5.11]SQE00479.1 Amidohydrolase 2 [Parafrankia sp. Ea1.12]
MVKLADGIRVVDADAHMTERHDLFTERAPKGYEDRVPHVERIDGVDMWIVEGKAFGKAGSGGTVDHHGKKHPFRDSQGGSWGINDVHPAAWDPKERLRLMDELGIHTQVLYPNAIGIGGQNLRNSVQDPIVLRLCVELYNDAMAEVQAESGNRLLPMPIMPAWDIQACVQEAERCAALGYRGVNMTADPQDSGSPDLGDPAWDPFWEVCAGNQLPVHFHIGASQTALSYFGTTYWPSQDDYVKPAIGGASLFQNNSRVLLNSAYSGMFDRHPDLKMVSVESGIGWVPFMLEAMDYELEENAPEYFHKLQKRPSEYFASNWYATFWFEKGRGDLQHLVDTVGEDNIMFETDFPHPTCLHPDPLGMVGETIASLRPETQRKVMGGNAVKLYRV